MTQIASSRARTEKLLGPFAATLSQRHVEWHATAPGKLVKLQRSGDSKAAWKAWQRHLARRFNDRPMWSKLSRRSTPLLWAIQDVDGFGDYEPILARLSNVARGKRRAAREAAEELASWLKEVERAEPCQLFALECLGWCYALPQLALHVPGPVWWALLWRLIDTARAARDLDISADPLTAHLLGGELPLALGIQFPEIAKCRRLTKHGRALLNGSIADLLGVEGLPAAQWLTLTRPLLACWTRCRLLGQQSRKGCLDRSSASAFRQLLIESMRLTPGDGQPFLLAPQKRYETANSAVPAADDVNAWQELLQAAAGLDGPKSTRRVADAVLSTKRRKESHKSDPRPAGSVELSGVAALRSDWTGSATLLALGFHQQRRSIQLAVGKSTVLSGEWDFDISCDGRDVAPAPGAAWEEVCWEVNRRAQYVELELELTEGLRLERSALLAVEDEFLLLCDAVVGPPQRQIQYAGRLPLADCVSPAADKEMRELTLGWNGQIARLLPLALSEWRIERGVGQCDAGPGRVELQQRSAGGSLYAPLLIDLSQRRRKKPLTWRQLTVAEERRAVPRDVAVGYRIEIGSRQWVLYRAISQRANRSLLGQNLSTEFKLGRFEADGEVKTLMEIE